MQQKKPNELMADAFRLLDEMAESGGVYPSSELVDRYTMTLSRLMLDPSVDIHNFVLEIMVKLYYLRDSGKCLFVNLLLNTTYHTLKKDDGRDVREMIIYPSKQGEAFFEDMPDAAEITALAASFAGRSHKEGER